MMKATTFMRLRNMSLLLAMGALGIACAGKSVQPVASEKSLAASTQETAQAVPAIQTTNPSVPDADPATSTSVVAATPAAEEKLPLIDIRQYQQPVQRVFQFGFDKVELGEQDRAILEQHAQYLLENPQLILQIHGHTDHHGPREYNETLSKRRAQAVAQVLLAQGVKQSQLVIDAMADTRPLSDVQPGKNRRVEIEYTEINLVSNE